MNVTGFIGGSDVDHEGTWTWIDGSAFQFSNWGEDEPSGDNTENCLEMVGTKNGTWNDVPCDASHSEKAAICSFDLCKLSNEMISLNDQVLSRFVSGTFENSLIGLIGVF